MTRPARRRQAPLALTTVLVLTGVLAMSACKVERPPYGGDKERALVAATATHDVTKVQALLASGANPNKMVVHEGLYHSAWELALRDLRPRHAEPRQMVLAMLKAGANPAVAWGTWVSRGIPRRHTQEPIMMAMTYPDADVIRALLEAGLDPRHGQTALVMAIEEHETEIAHLLVDGGVDPNCHPGANTPLVAAIEARDVAMMTYLEEHGAREKP